MGKIPSGKVPFVWDLSRIKNVYNFEMAGFADWLAAAGVKGIMLKLVEGRLTYNPAAMVDDLAGALASRGIELHGWGYNYGNTTPERKSFGQSRREAELAAEAVARWNIQSWTLNCEKEWKSSDNVATRFKDEALELVNLHREFLDIPLGFTSYKFPNSHNLPWSEFINGVDFLVPQVYWQGATGVSAGVNQLDRSFNEWYNRRFPVGDFIPMIPAGTVYKESNYPSAGETWWPTDQQLENFLQAAYQYGPDIFPGVSIWEVAEPKPRPELWQTFSDFVWHEPEPEPVPPGPGTEPVDDLEARLSVLEYKFIELATGLYDAVAKVLDIGPVTPGPVPPGPEPGTEPVPSDIVTIQTSSNFTRVSLSHELGKNNANPPRPIMEFYPRNTSKVSERISVNGGASLKVYKDSIKADGGDVYWRVVKDQAFDYAAGSRPVAEAGSKILYLNNKFLV